MHKGAFSAERQRSHLVETQDDSVSVYARFQIRCERVMNARGYRLEPHRQARWQRGVSHCITRQEDHAAYKKMHAHPPRGRVYQSNDILQGEIVCNACSYSRGSGLWESPLLSHQQSLWKLICLFLHISLEDERERKIALKRGRRHEQGDLRHAFDFVT